MKKLTEVCICPECKFIYICDMIIECENSDCKRYGKKGIMADVITKDSIKEIKDLEKECLDGANTIISYVEGINKLKEEIKILSPKHKPKVKWGRNCYCTACVKIREIQEKIDQTFPNLHNVTNRGR